MKKSIEINDFIKNHKNKEAILMIEKGFDVNKTYKADEMISLISGNEMNQGTPLYTACRYQNGEMIHYLLEHGADPNVCRFEKSTALEMFFEFSYDLGVDYVNLFIEKGVDLEKYEVKPPMCCLMSHYYRASDEMKSLIEEELRVLIDHGVKWRNDNMKTAYGGYSIIHFVAAAGRIEFLKELMKYPQAKECLTALTDSNMTPYEMAKNNKRDAVCELLEQYM